MTRTNALIISLMALLLSAQLPAAEYVVIASNVDQPSVGEIIENQAIVHLDGGQTIRVIAEDGTRITLSGPYHQRISNSTETSQDNLLQTLRRVLLSASEKESILAVFRGKRSTRPAVWDVILDLAGRRCVRTDQPLQLWRRTTDRVQRASVRLAGLPAQSASLTWKEGQRLISWPAALQIRDGARYEVVSEDGAATTQLTLVVLPEKLPTDAHRAAWMSNHHCSQQARELLGQLARD